MIQYAITDRRIFAGHERQQHDALLAQAASLSAAQIDFLQLREKDLPLDDLLTLACKLRSIIPYGSAPQLLLNGPASIATAARFDGIHLPGGWTPADLLAARTAFVGAHLSSPTLSVTTHSLDEVRAARQAGASLILFGPVFEKRSHHQLVRPGLGVDALRSAAREAGETPLLALGGVSPKYSALCLAAGAAGIAAIRAFLPPSEGTSGDHYPSPITPA